MSRSSCKLAEAECRYCDWKAENGKGMTPKEVEVAAATHASTLKHHVEVKIIECISYIGE